MKHNKSNFKSKRPLQARQGIRRHQPRRYFPCQCCEFVMPIRYGKVFTMSSGKKLEVCSDCLTDTQTRQINLCANCNHDIHQAGVKLMDASANKSLTVCLVCFDSLKGITEHFNGEPHSDSESVF